MGESSMFPSSKKWLSNKKNTWIKSIRLLVFSNNIITLIVCWYSINITLETTDYWCGMWRLNMVVLLLRRLYHRKQMISDHCFHSLTDHSESPLLFSRQLRPRCTKKISKFQDIIKLTTLNIPDFREKITGTCYRS